IVALVLFILSLIVVSAVSAHRYLHREKEGESEVKRAGDRPAAASTDPRKLDLAMLQPPTPAASTPAPRIPAIDPLEIGKAEPIPVIRTAPGGGSAAGSSLRP